MPGGRSAEDVYKRQVPDYERRLSELLLYLQQFYGREMQRHSYGARSFCLDIKSPGRVNIIEYLSLIHI